MPNSGDDGAISNEIMLKTIRLSKNIFSLTERLPKAKYRSPKAVSGAPLQTINGSDIQKNPSKNRSRLQDYLDHQNGYDEEDMENGDSPDSNVNAHQRAKALKIKLKKQGMGSD